MLLVNKIALDFEPRRKFFSKLSNPPPPKEPEMTDFESAFLCGLLNKFRPKKILEVGVAAGGTTAIILECLEKIGQEYTLISVDIEKNFYRDRNKRVGFLADDTIKNLTVGSHKFYFDTVLPFVIDEIGDEIDFLILDTKHIMPGETLDFLVALPYLKENAIVCLHDVSLCQSFNNVQAYATTTLFSAVHADKFLNFIMDGNLEFHYPNIAAFQINSDTLKYIENIFLTLILRWRYLPAEKDLLGYAEMLKRYYSTDMFTIFREALMKNAKNLVAESQLNAAQK